MRLAVAALVFALFFVPTVSAASASTTDKLIDVAMRCSVGTVQPVKVLLSKVSALAPAIRAEAIDLVSAEASLRQEMNRELDGGTRKAIEGFARSPAGAFYFGQLAEDPCFGRVLFTPGDFSAVRLTAKGKDRLARLFPSRRAAALRLVALPAYDRDASLAPLIDALATTFEAAGPSLPFGAVFVAIMRAARVATPAAVSVDPRVMVLWTSLLADADFAAFVAFLESAPGRKMLELHLEGTKRLARIAAVGARRVLARALGLAAPVAPAGEKSDAEIEADLKKMGFMR